jgi:hypothetical protein
VSFTPPDPFGAPKQIIRSLDEIAPDVLEQIAQSIEQRGIKIPLANILGFPLTSPRTSGGATYGGTPFTTNSTAYSSLVGAPTLTNLRAGQYVVFFNAYMSISSSVHEGWIAVAVNGVDPSTPVPVASGLDTQTAAVNATTLTKVWGSFIVSLKQDTNTLNLRAAVTNAAATLTLWNAFLFTLRMGQS